MNAYQYRHKIEEDALDEIQNKLKTGAIGEARASHIAAILLEFIPEDSTIEELYKNILTLKKHIPELKDTITSAVKAYENSKDR